MSTPPTPFADRDSLLETPGGQINSLLETSSGKSSCVPEAPGFPSIIQQETPGVKIRCQILETPVGENSKLLTSPVEQTKTLLSKSTSKEEERLERVLTYHENKNVLVDVLNSTSIIRNKSGSIANESEHSQSINNIIEKNTLDNKNIIPCNFRNMNSNIGSKITCNENMKNISEVKRTPGCSDIEPPSENIRKNEMVSTENKVYLVEKKIIARGIIDSSIENKYNAIKHQKNTFPTLVYLEKFADTKTTSQAGTMGSAVSINYTPEESVEDEGKATKEKIENPIRRREIRESCGVKEKKIEVPTIDEKDETLLTKEKINIRWSIVNCLKCVSG